MTKDTMKKKAQLSRVMRSSLRDWNALFDSLRAVKDPQSVKVLAEQLMCQQRHMQETINLLGEMTEHVCSVVLTVDLDHTSLSFPQGEQNNGA